MIVHNLVLARAKSILRLSKERLGRRAREITRTSCASPAYHPIAEASEATPNLSTNRMRSRRAVCAIAASAALVVATHRVGKSTTVSPVILGVRQIWVEPVVIDAPGVPAGLFASESLTAELVSHIARALPETMAISVEATPRVTEGAPRRPIVSPYPLFLSIRVTIREVPRQPIYVFVITGIVSRLIRTETFSMFFDPKIIFLSGSEAEMRTAAAAALQDCVSESLIRPIVARNPATRR